MWSFVVNPADAPAWSLLITMAAGRVTLTSSTMLAPREGQSLPTVAEASEAIREMMFVRAETETHPSAGFPVLILRSDLPIDREHEPFILPVTVRATWQSALTAAVLVIAKFGDRVVPAHVEGTRIVRGDVPEHAPPR